MTTLRWQLIAGLITALAVAPVTGQVESENVARWYVCPGVGYHIFEGDEEVESGFMLTGRVGYDYSQWWTFEGVLAWAPVLSENFRTDFETGRQISRLQEIEGNAGVTETYALGAALDALFHFTRWERLDPYLTLGMGVTMYGDDLGDGQVDPAMRVGGGVMYHFNDEWAVRADGRFFVAGRDSEANAQVDAGLMWTWGARVPPRMVATGGPLDSDGDRLSDVRESELGTDPYDPDTDRDELSDGDEVLTHKTDPLNADTDYDGLKDGAEVNRHGTDPLKRDTDDGGVADGHEVIEDSTNPLDPTDDLLLIELNIQFDYDKTVINPDYFSDLNTIAKVMRRHPDSTARVEGHADKLKKSSPRYNRRLSRARAASVVSYLEQVAGIAGDRMEAFGYGFDRPKAANDPEFGNPVNRRVEVYLRNVDREREAQFADEAPVALTDTEATEDTIK